jgi:hypothetical protein
MHVIRNEIILFRIVKSALEIVERGLSVLGLTAMPDYTLDTHTKPRGFRVGIFEDVH